MRLEVEKEALRKEAAQEHRYFGGTADALYDLDVRADGHSGTVRIAAGVAGATAFGGKLDG